MSTEGLVNPRFDWVLERVEPAPCENCPLAKKCADEELACDLFVLYADPPEFFEGQRLTVERREMLLRSSARRTPSRWLYDRIYRNKPKTGRPPTDPDRAPYISYKLEPDKVLAIRGRLKNYQYGDYSKLGQEFGVDRTLIARIHRLT